MVWAYVGERLWGGCGDANKCVLPGVRKRATRMRRAGGMWTFKTRGCRKNRMDMCSADQAQGF
eukprot:scaffold140799_cov21-Tisochrysis_lutea.AAC.3